MNLGLYRSWLAFVAVGLVAVFAGWHWLGESAFGSRDDENVNFLLTSGWVAVACYVVLALYAVRRAAHRLRLSPEFAWKAKLPDLERAQSALTELGNRALRRELLGAAAIRRAAKRILREHGVQRVLAVGVQRDRQSIGLWRVQVTPKEPLGRLAVWLHAHIWLGFAAALLVWFHGGLRMGSTMGVLLNVLSYAVIGSGIAGAVLWTLGPTWLTRAERDLSVEKAFALSEHYDRKVTDAAATLRTAGEGETDALRRDFATLTGQQDAVRSELRRLGFYRELLRFWRLLHVPCSILLLALVAVHVLAVWWY